MMKLIQVELRSGRTEAPAQLQLEPPSGRVVESNHRFAAAQVEFESKVLKQLMIL
jgi:hypothetical protein